MRSEAAIRKSLQELPASLDETYERILISLSPEDKQFALHALKVLCAYGNPMDSDVLLGAMALSCTHEPPCFDPALVDFDSLQEACSCLIRKVSPGERVVLAHYTVKEYLTSDRLAVGTAKEFHIPGHLTWKPMMEALLRHWSCDNKKRSPDELEPKIKAFNGFATSAGLSFITTNSRDIASNSDAFYKVINMLDHSNSNTALIEAISGYSKRIWPVRSVETQSSLPSVRIVTTLLNIGWNTIAGRFLNECDKSELLDIARARTWMRPNQHANFLEICATGHICPILKIFLDAGIRSFNSDTILYYMIYEEPKKFFPRYWKGTADALIAAGADVNPVGFTITPLQVGVWCAHVGFVATLLEAGANPNAVGEREGRDPPFTSMSSKIGHLKPLEICRKSGRLPSEVNLTKKELREILAPRILPPFWSDWTQKLIEIEDLLRKYGATSDRPK